MKTLESGEGTPGQETTVILVVDDDDAVLSLISRVLKKHGFATIAASGGAEALEVYEQSGGKVDLLVSDIVMPGMQGPELAERLRARSPDLKVLLMSGYSEPLVASASSANDASTDFLQKPFSPADLIARVEELLRAS